jgi:hypothetical protein
LQIFRQHWITARLQFRRAPRTVKCFRRRDGEVGQSFLIDGIQALCFIRIDREKLPLIAPDATALPALVNESVPGLALAVTGSLTLCCGQRTTEYSQDLEP